MKNFTFLAITALLFASQSLIAQKSKPAEQKPAKQHLHTQKCNTAEAYEELFRTRPGFKAQFEANQARLNELLAQRGNQRITAINDTIPIVIHVIGSAAIQAQVTDAILQSQIDVLNEDFQGKNADSTRIPAAFKPLYGKMGLTFMLAQTDPNGQATNGIDRRTNSITFGAGTADNAKQTSQGGLDAWNPSQYMNLWVVSFGGTGLLGISVFPGDPRPIGLHGFVCDYRAFGRGASYLYAEFNKGRTTTHELGHFYNLRHIWGDDGGSCAGTDFPSTPFGSASDDTPNQGDLTLGDPDPFGVGLLKTDNCSPAAPGVMYQNYMDYTDDIAMVMFTKGQAARMEGALTLSPDRMPVLNSNTYKPPVLYPNDASLFQINTPSNGGIVCGSAVSPQVIVRNSGTNTLTTVTITMTLNGTPQTPQTFTVNLASTAQTIVTLASISPASGSNTLLVTTSMPSGVADNNTANDSKSVTFTRPAAIPVPITQNFEGIFPPAPWTVINPDASRTWMRRTPGRNSNFSMFVDNYNYQAQNQIDDFRSPPIITGPTDVININFDLAHKHYDNSATYLDTLTVLVSNDCGATYTSVYKKWGTALNTTPGAAPGDDSFVPTSSDWRTENITVPSALTAGGEFIVVFRNTTRYGNNTFIDNISIQKRADRDIRLSNVLRPTGAECSGIVTPQVQVFNNGNETVTQFKVGYRVDNAAAVAPVTFNQSIAPGASVTVTLPAFTTTSGNHSFATYTSDPVTLSGTGDILASNDTMLINFSVLNLVNQPFVEGFENGFPPAGWSVINLNANATWQARSPGRNSNTAAFINNYDNDTPDQTDEMRMPAMNVAGLDSVILTFDLAHKNYPVAANSDTLTVLMSTDCGATFTSVYRKWGAALATAGASGNAYLTPAAADWRTERIAIGGNQLAAGSAIFTIRNTNRYGNNIFIDNVNYNPIFKRNLSVTAITQPSNVICTGSITPTVKVKNMGSETINTFTVSYSLNGGAVQPVTINTPLPRDAETTVILPGVVAAAGTNSITFYSSQPVSLSGSGDQYLLNDTLRKTFSLAGVVQAPMLEGFEAPGFPPAGWSVSNYDGGLTWQRANTGRLSTGSATVNNFNYSSMNQIDELYSPVINFSPADSVKLKFDLASVSFQYPGSAGLPLDTLEILITKDCGTTFTSVYKKWGAELQTILTPNVSQTSEFIPSNLSQWRTDSVDLSGYANDPSYMIVFRNTANFGNNIYIDNVSFSTRILPQQLKQNGYLLLPNVTRGQFGIWHYQTPTSLRYVNVYNSAGQLLFTKQFSGNAEKLITVDLSGKPAGIYMVRLGYQDGTRNVTERIIKQ